MRSQRVAALGVLLAAACGGGVDEFPELSAPAHERAAIVIEPPHLRIGDVANVEITVVTPPGQRLRPVRPPESVPGFWVLEAEALPTQRDDTRWVHRSRLRARAREAGSFVWPATTIGLEGPEGDIRELELAERPLEVSSVEARFPEQRSPFSLRRAPERLEARGLALPVALGAGLALLCVAVVMLVRRTRATRRSEAEAAPPVGSAGGWRAAQARLEAALERLDDDPERAADTAASALRAFFAERFAVATRSLTTDELRGLEPPFGTNHWPALLEILDTLDAVRFRPTSPEARATTARDVREATQRAQRLVSEVAPEARWK